MSKKVTSWSATKNHHLALVGAAALAILVVVLFVVAQFTFLGETSAIESLPPGQPGTVLAVTLDAHRYVTATSGNELTLWKDNQVRARQKLANLVGAVAPLPNGGFVIGTAAGQVLVLDDRLQTVRSASVGGRVSGISVGPQGDLAVTYGYGTYAPNYRIDLFDASGKVLHSTVVGFATSSLVTLGGLTIYGNAKGNVGAVDATDRIVWTKSLEHEVTRLAVNSARGMLLAGDRGGVVYRLSNSGVVVWQQKVSAYPIDSLAATTDGATVLAGSDNGVVYVLSGAGKLLLTETIGSSPVVGILPDGTSGARVITQSGTQRLLNLGAIESAGTAGRLQIIWYVVEAVLILLSVGLLLAGVGRWRGRIVALARRVLRARVAYLLVAPSMILILIFSYYPAITAFYYALTNFSLSAPIQFIGLQNFVLLAQDNFFWLGLKNMILLLVTGVLKEVTAPLLIAELIFWLRRDTIRYWFRTAFVLPAIVPGIVTTLMWKMMYDPGIGLINEFLKALGLGQYQQAWLGNSSLAIWSIIFSGFPWVGVFAFLIYLGGLLNISTEVYDAANVDGANWLTRFVQIDVPMLRPQFRLILFFAILGAIQGFANIWIFTQGGPGDATYVPALEMFVQVGEAGQFGYASAIGVVLFVVVFVVTLFNLRFTREVEL